MAHYRFWTTPIALVASTFSATAEPIQIADLAGKTIETSAGERRIALVSGKERAQTARFRSILKLGAEGQFTLTSIVNIDDALMGHQSNSWRATGVIGKPFAFRDGQRVYILENDQITWMRTMGEGASIGIITLARQGDRLTCSYKTSPATEPGTKNLKSGAHQGWKETRFFDVKQLGTACKVAP